MAGIEDSEQERIEVSLSLHFRSSRIRSRKYSLGGTIGVLGLSFSVFL